MSAWRAIQRESFRDVYALADYLQLDVEKLATRRRFPLLVPRRLVEKMEKGNLNDPILRQFVPLAEEEWDVPGFRADPVDDRRFRKQGRLLQKYKQRVLLTATTCSQHCRYCFRQNFDYVKSEQFFESELRAIADDDTLREVVLSGGDPLSLANDKLDRLLSALDEIPHLRRVRFHTRFPIGIPERIDRGFLELLRVRRCQTWFVIHCNHPRELDKEVLAALQSVGECGVPLLNQAVLLKGVNNDFTTLKTLCEILVDHGIAPYYLHQLDKVAGAAHFEVSETEGAALMRALSESLSGYAVPQYVREDAGAASKTAISW